MIITCNFIYAIVTREEKEIIVKKKYKFDRSGFTDFMIIDSNNKHYNLNNSLWYWKWDSIEDWHLIKEEQKIAVQRATRYFNFKFHLFFLTFWLTINSSLFSP